MAIINLPILGLPRQEPWRRTSQDGEKIAEQVIVQDLNDIMWGSFDNMAVVIEDKEIGLR